MQVNRQSFAIAGAAG